MAINESNASELWAGVDVGTQSLRVQLIDETGAPAGHGSGRLTSVRGAGVHEQDPEQWWSVLGTAFRQALAGRTGVRIGGVAICSTSGTFLLADADGQPRTPALMYDDARAEAEAREVAEAGADRWWELGYPMQRSWALPKLVWLLRNGSSELRAEARSGSLSLLHCADFLARRLTGAPVATDWSHALKTGYDLDELAWPTPILDKLDVPVGLLPPVARPGHELGRVGPVGAAHTGLPVGTPVRAGMTDGCAAQTAAGALDVGAWNSVLGTTLVLKGVTGDRLADPGGVVYSHRHPDGGWLPGGASNVGAGVLQARFGDLTPTDRARLEAAAAQHEPAGGLIYPLVSSGERFPFVRPAATAFELGAFADDDDRYAAILQGVAFVERLCLAYLRRLGADVTGPLSVTGGATRSDYWTQLRADILCREIVLPAHPEPAFGAAIIAVAGDGPLAETARRLAGTGRVTSPRPVVAERFAAPYARFVDALHERGYIDAALAGYAKEAQ